MVPLKLCHAASLSIIASHISLITPTALTDQDLRGLLGEIDTLYILESATFGVVTVQRPNELWIVAPRDLEFVALHVNLDKMPEPEREIFTARPPV